MKINLVHDWLRVNAGSEKVVQSMVRVFKNDLGKVYTLFNKLPVRDAQEILEGVKVKTTWLQFVPGIQHLYKYLMPFFPFVVNYIRLDASDVVISSSHAVAKGCRIRLGQLHICYCHTPMRYAWSQEDDYLKSLNSIGYWFATRILHRIRKWDRHTSGRVHYFLANSKHIQKQIEQFYHRDAVVIYPPVQTTKFALNPHPRQSFYLAPGRFVNYKRFDLIIEAFRTRPDLKLVLLGDGYDSGKIRNLLVDIPNITWIGYQHDDEVILYMQQAKACIFASKEDFGIMCVEAQATGTPVIALRYGGHLETVLEGVTGYFFEEQTSESLLKAIGKMESNPLQNHLEIRQHTLQFDQQIFENKIQEYVREKYQAFKG